ncbi:ATPase [Boudabousia tangfeifanii]|uniref:ATPase n=1 Tax=Boudabousia tangfeifanii TaxID=1912795 RepID=A0A1D9MKD4_9ACTO|nr:DUF349 domain-containing protein [Boudabousia tangfeifanii]AOZ72649.1 ATPase [Boudabousia tangfeifanii]
MAESAESTVNTNTESENSQATQASTSSPESFGRIDDAGNVWVRDGEQERQVGQYPDGVPADGLELFVRRFLDLEAQVNLFAARLSHLSPKDIDHTIDALRRSLVEPRAVGDLPALRARVESLAEVAEQKKQEAKAARAKAKEEALSRREKIVEAAEAMAAQDPERIQWKQSSQKFHNLLDEWKQAQKAGPRLDRSVEDALWKRFSSARTLFDRHRRQFFSALDARQAEAKATKEKLIAEAEELSTSTQWGPTSAAFRGLMDKWKAAGRTSRKDDDALWERFRAAQQRFFDARNAANSAMDEEFGENLSKKEALLTRAEAILPVTDVAAAKAALRPIQDEWEQVGRVPRADVARIEKRMRAVEEAIRNAENEQWRKSNPETKARAAGMKEQLEALIAEIDAEIEAAKAAGDEAKVAELTNAKSAREAWLAQVNASVED